MAHNGKSILFKRVAFVICAFVFQALMAPIVHAATFQFVTEQATYHPGELFTVTVTLSSPDQSINAVSGAIFVPETLDVFSISQPGSIIDFWVQPPDFSSVTRLVSFAGVVLNPGFQGEYGRLFQIQLRENNGGTSSLIVRSSSILAHDGEGTDVVDPAAAVSIPVGGAAVTETERPPVEESPEGSEEAGEEDQTNTGGPVTSPTIPPRGTEAAPEAQEPSSDVIDEGERVTTNAEGMQQDARERRRNRQSAFLFHGKRWPGEYTFSPVGLLAIVLLVMIAGLIWCKASKGK